MDPAPTPATLQFGDVCGYFTRDVVDYGIAIKTWTKLAHVEIYEGDGMSVASRNGIGVNRYPFRKDGLAVVRRPHTPIDREYATEYFNSVRGQKYDWLGLLCFTLAVRQGSKNRQFCSEFMTNWYKASGYLLFNPEWSADRVPPSFMMVTTRLNTVWKHPSLKL